MKFSQKKKAKIVPLSFLRKAVRASASVSKRKNTIHFITEIDVTMVIKEMENLKREGRHISMTTYIAKAFASTVKRHEWINSFISHGRQVFLDDIAICILMERELDGISVPEPLVIHDVDKKTLWEIAHEIQLAKEKSHTGNSLGDLSNVWYFKLIPGWLLKSFITMADQNIKMGIKYGKLAITSVGMFSKRPYWIIPHGSATILLSIGTTSIKNNGQDSKKLHLTVSFDHDIVDGAPAARFIEDLCIEIESIKCIKC
jgi:pyruvate/2-oxoglutarate dehydrogenase complex dihydrolipoamide acyltransferase (E2) component